MRSPRPEPSGPGLRIPRRLAVLGAAAGLAGALLGTAAPAAGVAHPHYLRLLRQGAIALEQGEAQEAVGDLELACFGLLEEPPLLGECLGYLALARVRAGDDEGFRTAFRRIVEVEERFGGYREAELPPALRAELEEVIAERISERTLRYSGVFARLAPQPEPEEPEEPEVAAGPEPEEPSYPPAERPGRQPADQPAELPAEEPAAGLGPEERAELERARELLARASTRLELEEPYRLARRVADANPDSREAQHLAATIAYRSARWSEAVTYYRRGGEPTSEEAEELFYLAVSLYESGETELAADALRRSLPGLQQTPFVRSYREKILGPPAAGGTGTGADGAENPASRPELR